jgi:hypothetical protein
LFENYDTRAERFASVTLSLQLPLPIELVAGTSDGTVLAGSRPNAFGGFGDWTYTPKSGKTIFVKSGGSAPDLISAKKVD